MESVKNRAEPGSEYVGLILAAGYSSRMKAFKPLLPIGDMTAIERISATLKQAGVKNIVGVTGFQRELLKPVFAAEGIREAYNPDFAQGMFTSVKAGLRKALADWKRPSGFFLMLADCPLAPSTVLRQIAEKHEDAPEAFIVPCFRGKKGHPLFIPARYAVEILACEQAGGLKAVTDRHEDRLIRLETGLEAVVLDMDTPEGYQEILEYHNKYGGKNREPLQEIDARPALSGKRLFLIRHGEIRQHREKIFLGQTDVPLSDKGREQAASAAAELLRCEATTERIYTSDLARATETAEIISRLLNRKTAVIQAPRLREMSLGDWDGRHISEIREKYPEEYRRRGENLLTWKRGNASENFYDLQYRVMKELADISARERTSSDLVIVAHAGVISVIASNLLRTDLAEQAGNKIPNGGILRIDCADAKAR